MALINHAKREINAKIIYYGPQGVGKRSSLQYIYDRIKPSLRGDLKAPSSNGDSLFFFDFSPFENPVFGDYRIRFHVYTLPGTVLNPAAWKMTLKGADGLVIVANATASDVTRESISVLRGFLSAYGVGLHDIPCVLQLDKNSAGNSSASAVATTLDLPDMPVCLSEPVSGEGVLETFSLLSREIMVRIGQDEALQAVEDQYVPAGGEDAEVSAALLSLEMKSEETPLHESHQLMESRATLPLAIAEGEREQLQIAMAGDGAVCSDGVVKIPLEFTLGGVKRRLVVSIAIDEAQTPAD